MNLSDIIYLDPVRIILDVLSIGSLMLVSKDMSRKLRNKSTNDNILLYMALYEPNYCDVRLSKPNYYGMRLSNPGDLLKQIIQITNINPDNLLYFINQIYDQPSRFIANSVDDRLCSDINYLLNYHSDKEKYDLMAQIYGLANEYVRSDGCHHMFIEQYFGGCAGFNKKICCEPSVNGSDFMEHALIKIILPDLPDGYKYKQQWDYNFLEFGLVIRGSVACTYKKNIQSEKNKLIKQKFMENQFHSIIDNTILYHIDFGEIFGKGKICLYDNNIYGIPVTFMDCDVVTLHVRFGDITNLIDMPVDDNDLKILRQLQIEEAYAICKYVFYDIANCDSDRIRDRTDIFSKQMYCTDRIRDQTDIFSQQMHCSTSKIIEKSNDHAGKIYTLCTEITINHVYLLLIYSDNNFEIIQDSRVDDSCVKIMIPTIPYNCQLMIMIDYDKDIIYEKCHESFITGFAYFGDNIIMDATID